MLRLAFIATCLALLAVSCEGTERPTSEPASDRADDGPSSAYSSHVWTEARDIPDGDRRGILIGPVLTADDGTRLGPVILRLAIRHPRPGDLDSWLAYDGDEDGDPEVRAPVEFFRSRREVWAEEVHGCPVSLEGTYFFWDGREAVFAPFQALRRGHAFYLVIADTLAGDTGSVLGWAVYTKDPDPATSR